MSIEKYFLIGLVILAVGSGIDSWSDDRKAERLGEACYKSMGESMALAPDEATRKSLEGFFHCDKVGE